jgi:hypothetical protein
MAKVGSDLPLSRVRNGQWISSSREFSGIQKRDIRVRNSRRWEERVAREWTYNQHPLLPRRTYTNTGACMWCVFLQTFFFALRPMADHTSESWRESCGRVEFGIYWLQTRLSMNPRSLIRFQAKLCSAYLPNVGLRLRLRFFTSGGLEMEGAFGARTSCRTIWWDFLGSDTS